MIHPSSITLPSTLLPEAPSQAPWFSCSSGFSASFAPETGIRMPEGGSSSGWLTLRRLKVTFSKSSLCHILSHLSMHQTGPLPWGKLWHWLSPRRETLEICTRKVSFRVPTSLKLCRAALPAITCPSYGCILGGVWGIVCNRSDSQPTKPDQTP